MGAVAADRGQGGGTLARHLSPWTGAIALTLALLAEPLFADLSCDGR